MAQKSAIQWTDASWNIGVGCSKVDGDCKNCYMFRDSLKGTRYTPNIVRRTTTVFNMPLKLKEPSKIFTCSLTDFFHEDIDAFRHEAWDIIRKCPQHTFQILTKRPERIAAHLPEDWGKGWDNVWLGTSVGSQKSANIRVPELLKIPTKVRFLSIEPLYEPITFYDNNLRDITWFMDYQDFDGEIFKDAVLELDIDWVIVGGESGNENGQYRCRPCELEWIETIVKECQDCEIPVFVKQLGTHLAKQLKLKDRHGGDIDEFPEHLKIREFPKNL